MGNPGLWSAIVVLFNDLSSEILLHFGLQLIDLLHTRMASYTGLTGSGVGDRPARRNEEMKSVPFDPRFQNTNQTRNCWQNYVDYHRCINLKGEEFEPCQFFFKNYLALCPVDWAEKWDEQRDNGSFPTKL